MPLPAPLRDAGPVMVAPMAGGPSTPELVVAASAAGAFAQLAGGYKSAEALGAQVDAVRSRGVDAFGVNLFVPNVHPIADVDYATYADRIRDDLGSAPVPAKVEDDDAWEEKVALLLESRVPVVSFTFGLPDRAVIAALVAAGIVTMQTVTSVDEARAAEAAGIDALILQGAAAGGHSGIWAHDVLPAELPLVDLLAQLRAATELPIVAAGGVSRRAHVRALLETGADAVAVGTAVLRAHEAGTSATHRSALADESFDRTTLTRAFTGRPARALVNRFVERHDAEAPSGYPALHHLTRAMRADAAAAGDSARLHLWAGRGWRDGRAASVADILADLTP